jgi:hypothetical protein
MSLPTGKHALFVRCERDQGGPLVKDVKSQFVEKVRRCLFETMDVAVFGGSLHLAGQGQEGLVAKGHVPAIRGLPLPDTPVGQR